MRYLAKKKRGANVDISCAGNDGSKKMCRTTKGDSKHFGIMKKFTVHRYTLLKCQECPFTVTSNMNKIRETNLERKK